MGYRVGHERAHSTGQPYGASLGGTCGSHCSGPHQAGRPHCQACEPRLRVRVHALRDFRRVSSQGLQHLSQVVVTNLDLAGGFLHEVMQYQPAHAHPLLRHDLRLLVHGAQHVSCHFGGGVAAIHAVAIGGKLVANSPASEQPRCGSRRGAHATPHGAANCRAHRYREPEREERERRADGGASDAARRESHGPAARPQGDSASRRRSGRHPDSPVLREVDRTTPRVGGGGLCELPRQLFSRGLCCAREAQRLRCPPRLPQGLRYARAGARLLCRRMPT
mmetsp:Transcript_74376/g.206464  ORF Transcript_74376/g.206464 Transcript_74376/m.206464 type:complete len:278 (-) Transcript_74376:218-1051(-)